ncbi:MAG: hypothetical protein JW839_19100 [Candidatus Lokiarchaeota archaeon]|nr:hypothetical protein [Candidatus Lokiarchaeota archaeon]
MASRTANKGRSPSIASKVVVFASCTAIIAVAVVGIANPVFYSPERAAQVEMLNTPGSRTVFTTYFYWYRSGGPDLDPVASPHCSEIWSTAPSYPPKVPTNASDYPEGWPGPTDPALMVQNDTGTWGYHDSCSYHPPAELPEYNATGGVIEASLKNGTMEHMGTWFDWKNETWHEWELRGMMRAGIDVLIPVYWWNGIHNDWSIEGVEALVIARNALAPKLVAEGQASDVIDALNKIPKIALFYDTTCMRQLWCHLTGNPWDPPSGGRWGPDLNDPAWQQHFWDSIDDFLALLDDNCTYFWNGRYVVWMYGDGWFSDVGTEVLEFCRQQCLAKYGRSIYFVGPDGWYQAGADGLCNWGACFGVVRPQTRGILLCAAVGPGFYNLGAIALQTPLYKARDFTRYEQEWRQVMDEGAAWVHVETWNELHEGTNIAWTQEYGWDWIDATRAMTDEFHAITGYDLRETINWTGVYVTIGAMVALLSVAAVAVALRRL